MATALDFKPVCMKTAKPVPYMTQMEYCHNLIFHKHAAVNRLFQRLLDLNRAIGTPEKLAIIFARPKFQADTRTAQTTVKITRLRTPVLRTGFKSTDLKQYIKDGALLRTETSTFQRAFGRCCGRKPALLSGSIKHSDRNANPNGINLAQSLPSVERFRSTIPRNYSGLTDLIP